MSILTKILIVLLALSSIFLCGIVVTYVASSNNYKAMHEDDEAVKAALRENVASLKEQLNEQTMATERMVADLKSEIQGLEITKEQMQVELANKERNNSVLLERVNSWTGVVKGFEMTISNMEQELSQTRLSLDKGRTEQIQARKSLNEIASQLSEKLVQLDALEAERRRLLEEKSDLEQQMTGVKVDDAIEFIEPVTPSRETVRLVPAATGEVELRGMVSEVDLANSLVTLSLGTADGVREGLTFHITRGDVFVCNVVITEVDVETSAGTIDIMAEEPQVSDNASTGW